LNQQDYSDSHKNDNWQNYAAVVAAAFAKELLKVVVTQQISLMPPAAEALMNELKNGQFTYYYRSKTGEKANIE
jgi:hypothetical protein